MAVYYRYKSGVQTFSVPLPAPSVSVADLKKLILGTARHGHGRTRGRGQRETVALSDARTGEEYTDDSALVLRSSTVLVRRVDGPPAETITVASSPPPPEAASSSAEDDEARAISAVIDAAQLKYDLGRASSNTNLSAPSPVSPIPDDGVPPELHCKICNKVMADAVVASRCCFGSFCDTCIRGQITAKSRCVCGAHARADHLIPNLTLRATIAKLLATSAAGSGSGGTDNRKSSAGSNAEPTSRSAAASHVTATAASEHSEGSASSTSKSAAAPAPREPRTKQTTAESAETGAHAGYPE
ncbi:hypothetical protein BAE44_0024129, partial [Dichanthelium oligosanthes]